jgi:hypothetical protein
VAAFDVREAPPKAVENAPDLRIPFARIDLSHPTRREEPCPRCGSLGFTVHQRMWKKIRDPHVSHVEVDRYRCKRCRWAGRTYPEGIGRGRQSDGLRDLSVLLYAFGLSYSAVHLTLGSLGCVVSETTVRHNVRDARLRAAPDLWLRRLRLDIVGPGELEGPDGALALRITGSADADRWLEVTVVRDPLHVDLRWRLEHSTQWLAAAPREQTPPGSAQSRFSSDPRS